MLTHLAFYYPKDLLTVSNLPSTSFKIFSWGCLDAPTRFGFPGPSWLCQSWHQSKTKIAQECNRICGASVFCFAFLFASIVDFARESSIKNGWWECIDIKNISHEYIMGYFGILFLLPLSSAKQWSFTLARVAFWCANPERDPVRSSHYSIISQKAGKVRFSNSQISPFLFKVFLKLTLP